MPRALLRHQQHHRNASGREFVDGIKAGSGTLQELLTTALSELCKVKPEGLDAVRSVYECSPCDWVMY